MRRRHQLAKPASPLLLCLLLGCAAMIADSRPRDWPALDVQVHTVSMAEVSRKCTKYLSAAGWLLSFGLVGGCAEVNFAANRCDIWVGHDPDAGILEHERGHCFGADHPGETTLADAWANYKAGRR